MSGQTPKTDALAESCVGKITPMAYIRSIDLARQLETELAKAVAALKEAIDLLEWCEGECDLIYQWNGELREGEKREDIRVADRVREFLARAIVRGWADREI